MVRNGLECQMDSRCMNRLCIHIRRLARTSPEEYVAALDRKGYALIGKDDAKKAWGERDESTHDFYIIKRWLTHLGKFDEVAKLMDERKLNPKKLKKPRAKKTVEKGVYAGLDDIMEKLKSNPSLLDKVKKML